MSYPQTQATQGGCGCNDSTAKDNPTQIVINKEKAKVCIALSDSKGKVSGSETKFNGENDLYIYQKCFFINLEDNYRRYRNFEISNGTELVQNNESIKNNVTTLKDWNKKLNALLTNISKQSKELKSKFYELRDAACKLEQSYNDSCNAAQRRALTGTTKDACSEPLQVIPACNSAKSDIETLIEMPEGLACDSDSIFKVASDVVGIQLFSNIDSLDALQKGLNEKSSSFEKIISETMKGRRVELDKLQEDIVTSVKNITLAATERNWRRSVFEGYKDATYFLCCPKCGELCKPQPNDNADCHESKVPQRLKHYENCICAICGEVQKVYCCHEKPVQSAANNY